MPDASSLIEAAQQSSLAGYAIVASNTFWVWDLILSIPDDVKTFSGRTFKPYDLLYILARVATAGVLISSAGFLSGSGQRCQQVLTAVTWFETFSVITNSSLFLLRVLAVYADSSWKVKFGFFLAWSTTFLSISGPFSSTVNLELEFSSCTLSQVKPLGSPGFVAVTVFDTLVLIAISLKVLRINNGWHTPRKSWIMSFVCGDGLSHVSKLLLRSGQFYYFVTVGFNVFTVTTLLSKSTVFSPTFRAGFTFISLALQNIMTCKVFRLLRLGLIHNNPAGQLASLEFTSDDDPDNSREMRVLSLRRRDNEGCGESKSGHSNINHV